MTEPEATGNEFRVARQSIGRLIFVVALGCGALAVLAVALSFLLPTLFRGRGEAYKVQCAGSLKIKYCLATSYSGNVGRNLFPFKSSSSRAHEHLQIMLETEGQGITPKLFVCPEGEASSAVVDELGHFTLSADTCDYAWQSRRTSNTTMGVPLASDKYVDGHRDAAGVHRGHPGGMNVLMSDGSIRFVEIKDLPSPDRLPQGLTR